MKNISVAFLLISLASVNSLVRACTTGDWQCSGNNRQQCANNQWYNFPCSAGYTCANKYNCVPIGGGATTPSKGGGGATTPSSGGGGINPSQVEFENALVNNGYPRPTVEQYQNFVGQSTQTGAVSSKRESAMFLAEIMWESGGLIYKEEIACKVTHCPNEYRTGTEPPGKYYYGRGYIQLSWIYNYRACSIGLFGDGDRLVYNPESVATDDSIAWGSSFWFWKANVHNNPGVQAGQFGSATRIINGALECDGPYQDKARKRFALYKVVLKAFNVDEQANEHGCYN